MLYDDCSICGANSPHMYKRYLRVHMPWYMNPATSCVDCHMSAGNERELQNIHGQHRLFSGEYLLQAWFLLMNGMFLFLSQGLGLGSPIELLGCAAVRELTTRPLRFSEEELSFLREYDRRAGLEPLSDDGYLILPPTRLIVLMHPAVTSRLLAHLDPQTILRFRHHQQYSLANGSSPPVGYPSVKRAIIDTHFHLDSFSSRQGRSLSDLESSISKPLLISVPFAIANYVFPDKWSRLSEHVRADPRLRITLGVHPHMITENQVTSLFGRLEGLLGQYPEAVGVGEVGLDLTKACRHNCRDSAGCRSRKLKGQCRFLRLAFQLAKQLDKVLILHVRDRNTGEAAAEVLNLLRSMDMTNHKIHRHCFVGGEEEYIQWSTSLPNCYFSISPVTVRNPGTMRALSSLDNCKRLLLETDSAYLADDPWCVNEVAGEAARSLNMTMSEFVRVCNKNAARLYNLPW